MGMPGLSEGLAPGLLESYPQFTHTFPGVMSSPHCGHVIVGRLSSPDALGVRKGADAGMVRQDIFVQEGEGPGPGFRRRLFLVDVRSRVVEEGVGGARILVDLAHHLVGGERADQVIHFLLSDRLVVLRLVIEHGAAQGREFFDRHVAVEDDGSPELTARAGEAEAVGASHGESECRDPVLLHIVLEVQVFGGVVQIMQEVGCIYLAPELRGELGIAGDRPPDPAVLIHGERHVAVLGHPKGELLEVGVEPPPLVEDEHGGIRASLLGPGLEALDEHLLGDLGGCVRIDGDVQRVGHAGAAGNADRGRADLLPVILGRRGIHVRHDYFLVLPASRLIKGRAPLPPITCWNFPSHFSMARSCKMIGLIVSFWIRWDSASALACTTFCWPSILTRSRSRWAFNANCSAVCLDSIASLNPFENWKSVMFNSSREMLEDVSRSCREVLISSLTNDRLVISSSAVNLAVTALTISCTAGSMIRFSYSNPIV